MRYTWLCATMLRLATSMRPAPDARDSSAHRLRCRWALAIRRARVFGIAQAAKRTRLHLWRIGSSGAVERPLMLLQALDKPSEREVKIAAQVVDPRALRREVVDSRRGRGLVQHCKGLIETIPHAKAGGGQAMLSATSLDGNISDGQGLLRSSFRSLRIEPEVMQDLTP